ncbi:MULTISPECIES: hypothetical protein [Micromonospora]|uniref:Uncharacterized protein n=1 Tax=Micromonospora yangpuensis TaxID=683228 RepID=A0A1C6V2X6_9ACTN|nr:hypothetical protein [Micromonospora yangpuensis]GGM14704.1 hypothetical protein GCM10012279_36050 [Micromonospora yangpuensis]SCL60702.1 hypothetical protein GA0070617_4451 [Micromonospora yangpuensis]
MPLQSSLADTNPAGRTDHVDPTTEAVWQLVNNLPPEMAREVRSLPPEDRARLVEAESVRTGLDETRTFSAEFDRLVKNRASASSRQRMQAKQAENASRGRLKDEVGAMIGQLDQERAGRRDLTPYLVDNEVSVLLRDAVGQDPQVQAAMVRLVRAERENSLHEAVCSAATGERRSFAEADKAALAALLHGGRNKDVDQAGRSRYRNPHHYVDRDPLSPQRSGSAHYVHYFNDHARKELRAFGKRHPDLAREIDRQLDVAMKNGTATEYKLRSNAQNELNEAQNNVYEQVAVAMYRNHPRDINAWVADLEAPSWAAGASAHQTAGRVTPPPGDQWGDVYGMAAQVAGSSHSPRDRYTGSQTPYQGSRSPSPAFSDSSKVQYGQYQMPYQGGRSPSPGPSFGR